MDPIVGGALIGAASGATNIIGNVVSGRKNRKHQRYMQEVQNKWASSENQLNRDFQKEMWNLTNEYNSASAQRQRLEEAGLNPYMMMSGSSAGTASASSAPSSAGGGSGSGSGLSWTPVSFSNGIGAFSSALRDLRSAEGQALSNFYYPEMASSQIGSIQADTSLKQTQSDVALAQRAVLLLDGEAKQILNAYLPEMKQVELSTMGATYWNLIRDGSIKEEQARNLIASRLEIEARTSGHRISNKIARSTADSLIRATRLANENQASYLSGEASLMRDIGEREAKMRRWFADPVKARWDRGINNAGRVLNGLSDAVNSIGNLFMKGASLRQGWRMFNSERREIFDDNEGHSYTRRTYHR